MGVSVCVSVSVWTDRDILYRVYATNMETARVQPQLYTFYCVNVKIFTLNLEPISKQTV